MLCTIAASRYSANICQLPRAGEPRKASRAFFSLDAMLALAIAIFAFASFSMLLSSAGAFAASQSNRASSESLAIGFSSHILDKCSVRSSYGSPDSYSKTNELDENCLRSFGLQNVLAISEKNYASISLSDADGELFHLESGAKGTDVFCTRRLSSVSGKLASLEACLS